MDKKVFKQARALFNSIAETETTLSSVKFIIKVYTVGKQILASGEEDEELLYNSIQSQIVDFYSKKLEKLNSLAESL